MRGNVAAVEPYNHTPQKSTSITTSSQQHQQIIQDLAMLKLKSQQQQRHSPNGGIMAAESDETKLARQKQHEQHYQQQQHQQQQHQPQGLLMKNTSNDVQSHQVKDIAATDGGSNEKQITKHLTVPNPTSSPSSTSSSSSSTTTTSAPSSTDLQSGRKNEPKNQTLPYKFVANNSLNVGNSSLLSHKIISSVLLANANNNTGSSLITKTNECDSEKAASNEMSTGHVNGTNAGTNSTQIVNSTPLNAINKSVAEPFSKNSNATVIEEKPAIKPKALHQIPSGNLVVPPRKPISSVAPTSIKSISQAPKVNMVAPNNNIQGSIENDKSRPALPPKPNKSNNNNQQLMASNDLEYLNGNNEINLPIKAKPLTIKKQPLSEQPKLRSLTTNLKTIQYTTSRRIEMPPAFLFPEIATAELKDNSSNNNNNNNNINDVNGNSMNQTSIISKLVNGTINLSNNSNNNSSQDSGSITSADETDKSITPASTPVQDEKPSTDSVVKRKRNLIGDNAKAKLARRVSFDPLALLLDASLEGELELVKKTAMQVTNPSAANDEGITALHNAICAGHLEIVK